MSKKLLMIFACVVLTVHGQQELRKEAIDAPQQRLEVSEGKSENMTHEREKRMPDEKQIGDGSYGYSWNVGNGVSYMKMHVGKSSSPSGTDNFASAQHEVINSLRDGGQIHLRNQNDKNRYEKLHKDFLKMSQQIAANKNKNSSPKPTTGNQKTAGEQEINFKDIQKFASFALNKEPYNGMKDSHIQFHEFNKNLKHAYAKFNKEFPFSAFPIHQAHSLKGIGVGQSFKSLQSSGTGDQSSDTKDTEENKPINSFQFNEEFLKNQQNFPFGGNLEKVFKPIELPPQSSTEGGYDFAKLKEANFQGSNLEENVFKNFNEQNEGHSGITHPFSVNFEQKHSSGGSDAVFKYVGETPYKNEGDKEQRIPKEFSRTQENAWSTQNVASDHQSVEDAENKQDSGEEKEENVESEIAYTPQTGNQGEFQINQQSKGEQYIYPQFAGFDNGYFNGMHPMMNQQLINDQVEKIRHIQQKIIENHFPGAGIYNILDGNSQHGFNFQGHPMQTQQNVGSWNEYNKDSEQSKERTTMNIQNNKEVTNVDSGKEMSISDVPAGFSYSHVRLGHAIGDEKRHAPFINNNAPSHEFVQNNFFNGNKMAKDESEGEKKVWRPQRYAINSEQHQPDVQNHNFESQKFKSEDYSRENDDRKGREIKSFEHLDQENTHAIDDHKKEHFSGSEGHEEAKSIYPHFHNYAHQEPKVHVITKAVPVHKELKIPVPQMVRHPILIPVPYQVLEPYPFKIPVPVTVEKTVEVPVEKVVHYPVEKPVPMKVVKEVRVPVPKPYPVKVPVYKIKYVHHNKKKHERV